MPIIVHQNRKIPPVARFLIRNLPRQGDETYLWKAACKLEGCGCGGRIYAFQEHLLIDGESEKRKGRLIQADTNYYRDRFEDLIAQGRAEYLLPDTDDLKDTKAAAHAGEYTQKTRHLPPELLIKYLELIRQSESFRVIRERKSRKVLSLLSLQRRNYANV
jgi:hypothetical protein